ncbi:pleckstrin homology domain-containing family G member 5 isoform X3 [Pectinophora gossypiella]|uniref:pleckstrin homology domain-containing family G member 5 isoform X3 n=1 Tax=Pectinophora gossypiella TaxID=13191 RepID=UPI00214E1FF2|nr:pleckstrin homology domain-containing family G member 5 isoform X3 [Pectinophora gossypiella]
MDRFRQKTKKEKPLKHVDKDNTPSFIADVKSIKENLKIKEILRTVKMNSSMRVKAPRGSKVMNTKDFNDNDDLFDDDLNSDSSEQQPSEEPTSATNLDVIVAGQETENNDSGTGNERSMVGDVPELEIPEKENTGDKDVQKVDSLKGSSEKIQETQIVEHPEPEIQRNPLESEVTLNRTTSHYATPDVKFRVDNANLKSRDRKLSLDHTMLSRREGLSKSELDLNSIGKSPLERKSSFFRKKMDSFLKNTTEIFKRQSQGSKPQAIQRKGSMSVSLQSLNENTADYGSMMKNQGSITSLQSSSTVGCSTSSLSTNHGPPAETDSLAGSQPTLSASQPIGDTACDSVHSLNEAYIQESLLNSRAISMSSGLDTTHNTRRRKNSNRSNRVTWVASEGLTNYFRRIIQDEKSGEMQVCHSYSDFTTIPENGLCGPRVDSKGRRLSYQRAVSGEDPVNRYQDTSLRRRPLIPENSEANYELSNLLAEFTKNGVPALKGFSVANVPDEAFAYLHWAEHPQNLEEFYDLKKLPPNEESRQAVIRELVNTEAVHIRHLMSIVEVFIAAAHALQDAGKMLDVDTERLFSNIPDVLNASLYFWDITIYPMLVDAMEKSTPFNTEFMSMGFCRFREIFGPYEKFVSEQTKALDYLRSLSNNTDFQMYLSWCHSQKECNRLQLADILVKPMQRLTKYGLILRRIIAHTDTEPERTSLIAMENFAKNYVLDLNRSIRQREELEKLDNLANSIESYEIEFKDEDLDRYFKMFSQLNLKAPMVNCLPTHSRSIIHEGDLRFKDNVKEMEVRVFLLTDMLLVCKKQTKGHPFKMIRPKYMVEKMICFPKSHPRNAKEVVSLSFVIVDEVGSSHNGFTFYETSKDPSSQSSLRLWEQKIREARLTYDLGVWFAKNPSRDLSEVEMDSSSEYGVTLSGSRTGVKQTSDDINIEREARERVAAMLHHRSMGASTEYDFSQASMNTDSFDAAGEASHTSGGRTPGLHNLRHPMHRNSTGGSSKNSRLSSFHQSTSAASHDEPQSGPSKNIYRAGSSVEHLIPPLNPDDTVTSITVNVVSESESETVVPTQQQSPQKPGSRSPGSGNTLRVQPPSGVLTLVHSLPDLTIEPSPPRPPQSVPGPQSASEKLYQSHQELLQRNRLSAVGSPQQHHQYLSPDHRGTSYPPPSPTRASLKRGLAFSYSFKNPPLSKMGHVNSQSQLQAEAGPSTSQQAKGEKGASSPVIVKCPSTEKVEKKSKQFISRNKGANRNSPSPARKDDKVD